MKKILFFLLAASTGMFFYACDDKDSSDIKDSIPFYQDYRTEFDVTNNQTIAQANFREKNSDGKDVKLTGYSKIEMNGQAPNYTGERPYFYNYTFAGTADVKYVFTRTTGMVYTNLASKTEVNPIGIPANFTTVNMNGTTVLTWSGEPVGQNETIEASVVSSVGGNNGFKLETVGATGINLPIDSDIPAGLAKVTISRVKSLPIQQSDGTANGVNIVVYTVSKDITVQ